MKNISELNIYPISEENLKALLHYFFPNRPQGDVKELCDDLKRYNLTIKDAEYAAFKVVTHIQKITDMLGEISTQTNLLSYGLEIFYDTIFAGEAASPERIMIIKTINELSGLDNTYYNLLSRDTKLFSNQVWN